VKLSGLGLPGRPWTLADNAPVIQETIDIFGPGRCLFASNFPVDGLCVGFLALWEGFRQAVADLPRPDRVALFHDNAVRAYRLALPPATG